MTDDQRSAIPAEAKIPTRYGDLRLHIFTDSAGKEHVAAVSGEVSGRGGILCRIHSECLTSEILGSLKCDCREQLEEALTRIGSEGGVVIYLRQEGRGIGLANKIRAYALQNQGVDTVDANRMLGFPDDLRSYELAGRILQEIGVKSVRLMTNNPTKISGLTNAGVPIDSHEPLICDVEGLARGYLEVKRDRMGHLIPGVWHPTRTPNKKTEQPA
jgi:GTP cyclohydrolase II